MSTDVVISPSTHDELSDLSLVELTEIVKKENDLALRAARTTLEHAVGAGEALLRIRLILLPEGKWTAWLAETFPDQSSTAYTYMRLARYKDLIPPGATQKEAHVLLGGLPSIDGGPGRGRIEDVRKEEARRWREEDPPVGFKVIAKRLDCSVSTVWNWFNGQNEREREARAALKAAEIAKTTRKLAARNETALAEAYALSEKLRDVLGQARKEAKSQEGRLAIKRAEEYNHVVRDSTVEALGAEA